MSRICDVTGKKSLKGMQVSHAMNHKIKHQQPNLHKKRFFIPETNQWVTLKVSSHALRSINKLGIYAYLQKLEKEGVDTGVKLSK